MAYYLSKKNRDILELFIPKFRDNIKDFSLELNSPSLLEKIIRNSGGYKEYSWIVEKWQTSVKGNRIYFKVKFVQEILDLEPVYENENIDDNEHDFFSVLNYLIISSPTQITFSNARLTVDELDRLKVWCDTNGYKIDYQDFRLRINKGG